MPSVFVQMMLVLPIWGDEFARVFFFYYIEVFEDLPFYKRAVHKHLMIEFECLRDDV